MKKLLVILLCLPMIGFGQSWRYSSQGNDFDGKYKISSIVGTGNDYPYNSPKLVICYTEKSNKIDFYISDAGYYTSSSNTQVMLSFNNEKGVIYKSLSLGYSSDRKSVFLNGNFSPNYLSLFEIFQKLMEASYVNVRIKNDYGQNDIRFSLKGSTKAIKYVIPYEDFLLAEKLEDAIVYKRDSVLRTYLKNYNLSNKMRSDIIDEINNEIKINGWVNEYTNSIFNNIDSFSLWKQKWHLENQYFLSIKIFYKSVYSQDFFKLINIEKNYIDSIPFAAGEFK